MTRYLTGYAMLFVAGCCALKLYTSSSVLSLEVLIVCGYAYVAVSLAVSGVSLIRAPGSSLADK